MSKHHLEGGWFLKIQQRKSTFLDKQGSEVCLSGQPLIELLKVVLGRGVCFRFRVKGFSMSPFVKDNDVITVSPLQKTSIGLGDVVAFIDPLTNRLIVHRITGKSGSFYLIKGDNTKEAHDLVPQANIIGCVKSVERNGKRVFLGLGPERFFIALLTRSRVLPLLRPVLRFMAPVINKLTYVNW